MILLPRLYNVLARYWEVPPEMALECWQALDGAEGAKPRGLRMLLLTFGAGTPDVADGFVRRELPPKLVVEAIEALIEEGRLTRQQATKLENHVLKRTMADGTWQP